MDNIFIAKVWEDDASRIYIESEEIACSTYKKALDVVHSSLEEWVYDNEDEIVDLGGQSLVDAIRDDDIETAYDLYETFLYDNGMSRIVDIVEMEVL